MFDDEEKDKEGSSVSDDALEEIMDESDEDEEEHHAHSEEEDEYRERDWA